MADPDQYERGLRHDARKEIAKMRSDLKLLERNGHEDIAAEFYYQVLLMRVFSQ